MTFRFKQFSVDDSCSAMKIGTDGVLLGAWSSIPNKGAILDVGCGSGLISLMAAQRTCGNILIDAVELNCDAARDAQKNFEISCWSDVLNVICIDFRDYASDCNKRYDAIISNPPFFAENILSTDNDRVFARSTSSLDFKELFAGVDALLSEFGTFSIISPADSYDVLVSSALENSLFLRRLTRVVTVAGDAPKRVMTEWGRGLQEYSITELVIRDFDYTPEYKALVRDFYLDM